jgi:hypothetical protein
MNIVNIFYFISCLRVVSYQRFATFAFFFNLAVLLLPGYCSLDHSRSIQQFSSKSALSLRGGSLAVAEDWKAKLARLESENAALREENQMLAASRKVKNSGQKTIHSFFYRRGDLQNDLISDANSCGDHAVNFSAPCFIHQGCNEESGSIDSSDSGPGPAGQIEENVIQNIMEETDRLFYRTSAASSSSLPSSISTPAQYHNPYISDTDRELLRMRGSGSSFHWPKYSGCRVSPGQGTSLSTALHRGRRRLIVEPGTHRLPRALRVTANATFLGASFTSGRAEAAPAAASPRVSGRWALAGGSGALVRLALDSSGGTCMRADGGRWRLDACSVRTADLAPLPDARHAFSTALCCAGYALTNAAAVQTPPFHPLSPIFSLDSPSSSPALFLPPPVRIEEGTRNVHAPRHSYTRTRTPRVRRGCGMGEEGAVGPNFPSVHTS